MVFLIFSIAKNVDLQNDVFEFGFIFVVLDEISQLLRLGSTWVKTATENRMKKPIAFLPSHEKVSFQLLTSLKCADDKSEQVYNNRSGDRTP